MFRRFEIPDRCRTRYAARPAPLGDGELSLRWLGTAGYELRTARTTLLIDPYLTRASLSRTLFTPLEPGSAAIDAVIGGADYVLAGHSHFDHLMDVPYIARRTRATVVGSD
ncbi:MAG: MBL fold metallo-hydrolase, partial [Candidatus Methylomirabilis sp.]|nr:MBL fold metallo-hydrolase [Deltaproteobacteria bacterium]